MSESTEMKVRALIEEQLGEFRQFAGLPSAEIEAMALRITRAIKNHIQTPGEAEETDRQNAA
ncbi:hypothetical protein [Amaricoccus macauensis]|uniref:hypothetical protein n=1 Tax=Amaricoccus macauensis TaxID=57001 RepID=UPI003C7BE286